MKPFEWDNKKNDLLKKSRLISFEEIVKAINSGKNIDVFNHPNQIKYPGQKIYVVNINKYIYLVPFIEEDNYIFLKTIFPSKKATKKYLGGKRKNE